MPLPSQAFAFCCLGCRGGNALNQDRTFQEDTITLIHSVYMYIYISIYIYIYRERERYTIVIQYIHIHTHTYTYTHMLYINQHIYIYIALIHKSRDRSREGQRAGAYGDTRHAARCTASASRAPGHPLRHRYPREAIRPRGVLAATLAVTTC